MKHVGFVKAVNNQSIYPPLGFVWAKNKSRWLEAGAPTKGTSGWLRLKGHRAEGADRTRPQLTAAGVSHGGLCESITIVSIEAVYHGFVLLIDRLSFYSFCCIYLTVPGWK